MVIMLGILYSCSKIKRLFKAQTRMMFVIFIGDADTENGETLMTMLGGPVNTEKRAEKN